MIILKYIIYYFSFYKLIVRNLITQKNSFQYTKIQQPKRPIILVPGTGASLLYAENKKTKEKTLCWIPKNIFTALSTCQKFLTCTYNEKTEKVESFCKDYYDIKPIPGKDGCNASFQIGNASVMKYFYDLIKFLESQGYVYEKTLFCFTYDWRQDISIVAKDLIKLVRYVSKLNNNSKLDILGHSLGNQVCDIYLRLDSDFNNYIYRYFAIAPPFDGCSGVVPMAYTVGYDMSQPLPLSICKQIEIQSGMMAYLMNRYNGKLNHFPCIFIKKRKNTENVQKQKQSNDIQILKKEGLILQDYSQIHLHKEIYGQEMPDLAFLLAEDIYKNKKLKIEYLFYDFIQLQKMCKKGAIVIDGWQDKHILQDDLYLHMERRQKPTMTEFTNDFEWEIYYPHIEKEFSDKRYLSPKLPQNWTKEQIKGNYQDLNKKIHRQGTFLGYFYQTSQKLFDKTKQIKDIPINFQKDSEFKMISWIGYGKPTKCHIYYNEIIDNYEDILDLTPQYAFESGDGTVLISSALADGYPDFAVQERFLKKNCEHSQMLTSKEFFVWLIQRV